MLDLQEERVSFLRIEKVKQHTSQLLKSGTDCRDISPCSWPLMEPSSTIRERAFASSKQKTRERTNTLFQITRVFPNIHYTPHIQFVCPKAYPCVHWSYRGWRRSGANPESAFSPTSSLLTYLLTYSRPPPPFLPWSYRIASKNRKYPDATCWNHRH